jgi:hypothetical protein
LVASASSRSLTVGVRQERERNGTEARRVVDEHVQPAKAAEDLQRDRIDGFLRRDVADDAVRVGMSTGDLVDAFARAGHERHASAAACELGDQREAQTLRCRL